MSSSSKRLRSKVFVAAVLTLMTAANSIWAAEGRVRRTSMRTPAPPPATAKTDDQAVGAANDAAAPDDPVDARRQHVNDADWFRDRAYRDEFNPSQGSVNGEFPSAELHDAVVANARAATARMIFRRAESALGGAVRDAKRRFEASAELKQALAEEKSAHEAFERARREAVAEVISTPRYQAILSMHEDLGEQIVARRRQMESVGQGEVTPVIATPSSAETSDLFAMASLRMQVAGRARAMERDAIEKSDELKAARVRLMAAAQKVSELRQGFDDSVREDPDLIAARNALEDARIGKVATAAYLRGALIVADEADAFAWYLHRRDAQVGYNPYSYDGYYSSGRYGYYWR